MHAISYGLTDYYPPCLLAAVLFFGWYSDCSRTYASIFLQFSAIHKEYMKKKIVRLQFNNPCYKQEKIG